MGHQEVGRPGLKTHSGRWSLLVQKPRKNENFSQSSPALPNLRGLGVTPANPSCFSASQPRIYSLGKL